MNDRFALGTRIAAPVPDCLNETVRSEGEMVHEICKSEALQHIKCPEGGREHGDLTSTRRPGVLLEDARAEMVIDRKGHCSPVFRSSPAAGVGCGNPINKGIAAKIRKASELWEPEHHLTQLRKEIDRKYEIQVLHARTFLCGSCSGRQARSRRLALCI